jgi:glycerol dehydrogenase-like iron-containing ADH family enzyme
MRELYLAPPFLYNCVVQDFHFTQFKSRFDEKGTLACACGQTHQLVTGAVLVSRGALEESAELLLRTRGRGCRVWVLSDENTEAAAGARWKSAAGTARITERVLPGRPKPHPTMALVDLLAAGVKPAPPDLLVSVGGGVISDLVKRLSLDLGLPPARRT